MSDLLFRPTPGHRGALLGDGVGGARVPVACQDRWVNFGTPFGWAEEAGYQPVPVGPWVLGSGEGGLVWRHALILIWHGEVAQEGCDRLARTMHAAGHPPRAGLIYASWADVSADYLAWEAERAGLGTVVRGGGGSAADRIPLVPRVKPGDTFARPDNGELAIVTAIDGDTVRGLCLDGREREFQRASAPKQEDHRG